MAGNLTMDQLKAAVDAGEIDTVVTGIIDMQGRLMGKRFHAKHFLDAGWQETHGCNYLLATDLEMNTVQGYQSTSWEKGYGDYVHKPDLSTLRRIPWLPGTALVLCDVLDHHTYEEIAISPRAILKKQVARARRLGFEPMMATELEFFVFQDSFTDLHDRGFRDLRTLGRFNVDYNIYGTTKDEPLMRAVRNGLYEAGIPVENSKGEAEVGQEEINIRYSDALDTADNHTIVKTAVKEIAHLQGISVTFMAKYDHRRAGSSSHIHQSLFQDGKNAFYDPDGPHGMSKLMTHYMAGLLAHASDVTLFLAPYVNSYKRFCTGLFAPTKAVWSTDNRTAGYRVCSAGSKSVRVECRVGGADLNPYLAMAAELAAGLDGVERALTLEPEMSGDLYGNASARDVPKTLREAARLADGSAMLRSAFGDEVVEHYLRNAAWEIETHERVVSDWEVAHGFEGA